MNRKKFFFLTTVLVALVAFPGCVINKLRAKNSLNEGVREFNKGKYEAAEEKFKFAMETSPDLANAQIFYARSINARFNQELTEDIGMEAIAAYENIIKSSQNNHEATDTALAFQADVYDKLSTAIDDKADLYKDKRRETLLRRAELPGATQNAKTIVYYTLGVSYFNDCHNLSGGYVLRRQPVPPETAEKMKPLIPRAHEYFNKALSVDPSYADAIFYQKLVILEESYAESNPARKRELEAEALKKENQYLQMQKQKQQQSS